MKRVAIAIPAYEAAPSIGDVVQRALEQVPEVLVVDDGSSDATQAEARASGARVVRLGTNCGKGAALRSAFGDLFGRGYEAVLTADADGQHLPEEAPKLIASWEEGAHLVIGSRAHLFASMGAVRRRSNEWSSFLISLAAGRRLADVQSGFRLYDRSLIEATGFPEDRFEAESAVVVRAIRMGFRVVHVPIRLGFADGRVTSHYRPFVDSMRIFAAVVNARLRRTT